MSPWEEDGREEADESNEFLSEAGLLLVVRSRGNALLAWTFQPGSAAAAVGEADEGGGSVPSARSPGSAGVPVGTAQLYLLRSPLRTRCCRWMLTTVWGRRAGGAQG